MYYLYIKDSPNIGTMLNTLLKTSKKISLLATIATLTAVLFSSTIIAPALAAPKLHGPITCQKVGANQLQCSFNVSGLGSATTATAFLSATVSVTTGCINQGSQGQQPQGLQRSTGTVTDEQTVNVQGGRATFTLTTDPLNAGQLRSCPDQMTPTIVCVSYSNISITVTTNSGQTATFRYNQSVGQCPTTRGA